MLEKSIAYHLEQLRQNQHVLDADGNIFSDDHRRKATAEIAVHTTILAELDLVNEPIETSPALATLEAMMAAHAKRIQTQEVRAEGTGRSLTQQMILDEIAYLKPEHQALEVAVLALREIAARPAVTHLKRGSNYDEFGRGMLQTERPLRDTDEIVVYRDRATRRWFARPPEEFDDGRFKPFDPVSGKVIA